MSRQKNVYLIFPIDELSVQIDKCKSSVKTALKELDDEGLLVRRSGGFSKPNHLYVKIPSDEIGLQPVDDKAVEKMVTTESEKQPLSGRKNGCAGVGNVAPSKVTEKYKSNKYHEVNYCYGEGESLWWEKNGRVDIWEGSVLPDDFMERITEIFLYQMDKKQSKRLLWMIVHKLLNKMV